MEPGWTARQRAVFAVGAAALALTLVGWQIWADAFPIDLLVYRTGGLTLLQAPAELYHTTAGLPFTYPPFAAMVFVPFALIPPSLAAAFLHFASLLALSRSIFLAVRTGFGTALGPLPVAGLVAAAMALEPVWGTFAFGQINLILLWLVLESLLAEPLRDARGALLGIASGVKLTPAVFLAIPLLERRWRMLAIGGLAGLATVVVGVLISPGASQDYWFSALWDPSRIGGVEYSGNQSLNGTVWRFNGGAAARVWLVLVAALAVVVLPLAGRLLSDRRRLHAVTVIALFGLLASPISWSHHWVWVVPMLVTLAVDLRTARAARLRAPAVLAAALAGAWLLALVSRAIWWPPNEGHVEFLQPIPVKLVESLYVVLGLVTLGWYAFSAIRLQPAERAAGGAPVPTASPS